MFVCVSLNPALDKRLTVDTLQVGKVNRVRKAEVAPGGKAAHVAMVLRTLGATPLWLGFAGGPTGRALLDGLAEMEIKVEPVAIASSTRTNLEIIDDGATVTEVLERGPRITAEELQNFEKTFKNVLAKSAAEPMLVTLSGSLPPGVPVDFYATLIATARQSGSRVFLDTSGEALKSGLAAGPDFLKPNQEEAEWLSGRTIHDASAASEVVQQFLELGAGSAAISLGTEGLLWRAKGERHALIARVPKQAARSCVGSGDATLAGFAFAAQQGLTPVEAVRLASACGVANCLADSPGAARAGDIARLKEEIRVEPLC